MTEERELRATSDKMLVMVDRLAELERVKRKLDIGTAAFVEAAREVERLARLVFRWSQVQLQLAQESQQDEVPQVPITEIAARPLDRILADWREAQLRLEAAPPGSDEAESAAHDVERLRGEFRAAQDVRR